jgi:RNA polymerase sigma-70 factor (ECF subfamily)
MKLFSRQDELYADAAAAYKHALERLVRAYEANEDKRRDLLQEVHLAVWQSFERYEGRCSMRTWVYRVAHNTAASYLLRESRRSAEKWISVDEIDSLPDTASADPSADRRLDLERLLQWIRRLKPMERQLMLLYLEDLDAESIGEITGMSAGSVRVHIHRIKSALARRLQGGGSRK